jgi:hypothetical protein
MGKQSFFLAQKNLAFFMQLNKRSYGRFTTLNESMKHLPSFSLWLLLSCCLGLSCERATGPGEVVNKMPPAVSQRVIPFLEGTEIRLASQLEGRALLFASDSYTRSLSHFDIQAKTLSVNLANFTDEYQYLQHAASQGLDWTGEEIAYMRRMIGAVDSVMRERGILLDLPAEIKVIKSTMREEGDRLGYARENYLVFRDGTRTGPLTFSRELFHLFLRHHPELRDEIYATINFFPAGEIAYPEALQRHKIPLPDVPTIEHFLPAEIDGAVQPVAFVTYADPSAYLGGFFYDYLKVNLMLLSGSGTDWTPVLVNGQPVLYELSQATNLNELLGRNSPRRTHPEEILADHFVYLLTGEPLLDPEFVIALRGVLE